MVAATVTGPALKPLKSQPAITESTGITGSIKALFDAGAKPRNSRTESINVKDAAFDVAATAVRLMAAAIAITATIANTRDDLDDDLDIATFFLLLLMARGVFPQIPATLN